MCFSTGWFLYVQKHNTDTSDYMKLFDQYLRCIPQFIGYKRGVT